VGADDDRHPQRQELFETLGAAIDAIYEAEVAAVERLTTVVAKL